MNKTDFKINFIRHGQNRTKGCVTFFEGVMENKLIKKADKKGSLVEVTEPVYVRSKELKKEAFDFEGILSLDELTEHFKKVLAKEKKREPIEKLKTL